MLEHAVGQWAREDGVTALRYIFLLRGSPALPEQLATATLVASGTTDVLLNLDRYVLDEFSTKAAASPDLLTWVSSSPATPGNSAGRPAA